MTAPLHVLLMVPRMSPLERDHPDGPVVPVVPAWSPWELDEAFAISGAPQLAVRASSATELRCEITGLRRPIQVHFQLDRAGAERLWTRGATFARSHPAGEEFSRLRIALCATVDDAAQLGALGVARAGTHRAVCRHVTPARVVLPGEHDSVAEEHAPGAG